MNDTQKKALRHLDTLTELVSSKISQQVEKSKVTDKEFLDTAADRDYRRQREREMHQVEKGTVYVVSFKCDLVFFVYVLVTAMFDDRGCVVWRESIENMNIRS